MSTITLVTNKQLICNYYGYDHEIPLFKIDDNYINESSNFLVDNNLCRGISVTDSTGTYHTIGVRKQTSGTPSPDSNCYQFTINSSVKGYLVVDQQLPRGLFDYRFLSDNLPKVTIKYHGEQYKWGSCDRYTDYDFYIDSITLDAGLDRPLYLRANTSQGSTLLQTIPAGTAGTIAGPGWIGTTEDESDADIQINLYYEYIYYRYLISTTLPMNINTHKTYSKQMCYITNRDA